MQTRAAGKDHRSKRARAAALVLCCALAAGVLAQPDTPAPDPAPPAKTEAAATEAADKGKAESDIRVDTSRPPDRFIPTEEIPEDFSVSFPVDI